MMNKISMGKSATVASHQRPVWRRRTGKLATIRPSAIQVSGAGKRAGSRTTGAAMPSSTRSKGRRAMTAHGLNMTICVCSRVDRSWTHRASLPIVREQTGLSKSARQSPSYSRDKRQLLHRLHNGDAYTTLRKVLTSADINSPALETTQLHHSHSSVSTSSGQWFVFHTGAPVADSSTACFMNWHRRRCTRDWWFSEPCGLDRSDHW